MRRSTALLLLAGVFMLAGGFIHMREWFGGYRGVPSDVPGSAVVRLGFPAQAAVSLLLAAALVGSVRFVRRGTSWVLGAAVVFQAVSIAALVISRTGTFLGWSEPGWSRGARQSLAVEIGALVVLAGVAGIRHLERRSRGASPVEDARWGPGRAGTVTVSPAGTTP